MQTGFQNKMCLREESFYFQYVICIRQNMVLRCTSLYYTMQWGTMQRGTKQWDTIQWGAYKIQWGTIQWVQCISCAPLRPPVTKQQCITILIRKSWNIGTCISCQFCVTIKQEWSQQMRENLSVDLTSTFKVSVGLRVSLFRDRLSSVFMETEESRSLAGGDPCWKKINYF